MDLNAPPLPEDDGEYFQQHDHETSVQTFHLECEERQERIRDHIDDRPMRVSGVPARDEGPHSKKIRYDRNKLPHGWLDCPNFGQEIAFIVPSKVPLDESFNDCIAPGKRYSFRQVFHMSGVKNFKIGMVVDLTNTDRYYSTGDFKKEGLKYLKIRCQGRDAVPDSEAVNTFVFEVARYIFNQSERQPKKRVFLHCTHGYNRTGYMIVHYLMRTQQAIQRFASARPPGIYKQDYIDSLYAFYHETKTELVVCPSTPEWKRSSDFDLNGEALPEEDDDVPYASINVQITYLVLTFFCNTLQDYITLDACRGNFDLAISVQELMIVHLSLLVQIEGLVRQALYEILGFFRVSFFFFFSDAGLDERAHHCLKRKIMKCYIFNLHWEHEF